MKSKIVRINYTFNITDSWEKNRFNHYTGSIINFDLILSKLLTKMYITTAYWQTYTNNFYVWREKNGQTGKNGCKTDRTANRPAKKIKHTRYRNKYRNRIEFRIEFRIELRNEFWIEFRIGNFEFRISSYLRTLYVTRYRI